MSAKILLVDDEEAILEICAIIFAEFDTDLRLAASGPDAFLEMSGEKFDLIITDLKMPRLPGDQLIKEIRAGENAETPIILLSGYITDEVKESLKDFPKIQFLEKPLSRDKLLSTVNSIVQLKLK